MNSWFRGVCYGLLAGVLAGFIGCAPVELPPPPPTAPVAISTFRMTAGKWAGILKAKPRSRDDDWVTLVTGEDGSYEFVSMRTIGMFHGKGTFTIIDGKLTVETERGSAVLTLYEEGGRRMLKAEGATKDGVQYSADLTPAQ